MTAVLASRVAESNTGAYDRTLHCIAGFFASEAAARAPAAELRQQLGLTDRQCLLLRTACAAWPRFGRLARSWAARSPAEGRSGLSDALLMAMLGGSTVALAILLGLAVAGRLEDELSMLLLPVAPLLAALAGGMASSRANRCAQGNRFNRRVRSELAGGRWVVLAHRVPPQQQARAAALLRSAGVAWCAVSVQGLRL